MNKRYIVFGLCVLLLGVIIITGCSRKKMAFGSEHLITAVADSSEWISVEGALTTVFAREVLTPQAEPLLGIRKISLERLSQFRRYHTILIVGSLDPESEMYETFNSILSPADRRMVENDSSYAFQKKNPWADNQFLLVLVAKDMETLEIRIRENADFLFNLIDTHVNELISSQLYSRYEQKKVKDDLMEKFGCAVRVPHDYFIADEDHSGKVVWLRRMHPERWFLMHWVDSEDGSLLNEKWCLNVRAMIGEKYYSGDKVEDGYTTFKYTEFLGRHATEMWGLWRNEEGMNGGPFHSYAFFDKKSKRIYFIDMACFAAGKPKMPYLRQLDVVANTFFTKLDQESE